MWPVAQLCFSVSDIGSVEELNWALREKVKRIIIKSILYL